MTDEELINKLRTESLYTDKATLEIMDLCMRAADRVEDLQDKNTRLKDTNKALESSLYNSEMNLEHISADLERTKDECRQIDKNAASVQREYKSEIERVTAERDKAKKCICDIETYLELGSGKYIKQVIDGYNKKPCIYSLIINRKAVRDMNIIKLRARNGQLFSIEKYFKNDNQFEASWNWLRFGLGINFWLGDMRFYLAISFLWLYIFIGICSIGKGGAE